MLQVEIEQRAKSHTQSPLWYEHRLLADFNHRRLNPELPLRNWREKFAEDIDFLYMEKEMLEFERRSILPHMKVVPSKHTDFIAWLMSFQTKAADFFDWLAKDASYENLQWFLQQEEASEQLGRLVPPLEKPNREAYLNLLPLHSVTTEALALGNIRLGLSMNPSYAFHGIGSMVMNEIVASARAPKVCQGLKRVGAHSQANSYACMYDKKWNQEMLQQLTEDQSQIQCAITEGALMRLNAIERCYASFENYFRENSHYVQ